MRVLGLFNIAALVSSLMILAMAYVLVPDKLWTNEAIAALVIFALAVGFIFYIPSVLVKDHGENDAAQMASIGPLGVITGLTLLLTSGAFVLSLLEMNKFALALDIFAVGTFIVSALMLRVASSVIGDVTTQYSMPSNHIRWQSEIQGFSGIASDRKTKASLEKLAEKFRYAASDLPGGTPSDDNIDLAINTVGEALSTDSSSDVIDLIQRIDVLIAQRDVFLRSKRNKA
jgi:hypothetical protein